MRGVARGSGSGWPAPIRLSRIAPRILSDAPCFFNSIKAAGLVAKSVFDVWISRRMMFSGMPAFIILTMSAFVSTLPVGACASSGRASKKPNRKTSWNERVPRMCGASLERNLVPDDKGRRPGSKTTALDYDLTPLNAQGFGTCKINFLENDGCQVVKLNSHPLAKAAK